MSVEISGPQGYEYQYLLTAYIAVSAYIRWGTSCQLIVEALNGEDAELGCEVGTIYIQAKLFAGTLDADQMLRWLEHAPRNNSSLWQKVAEDETRQALIVTSARCDDATSSFRRLMNLSEYKHVTSPLSPLAASNVLNGITRHDGSSKRAIKQTAKRIAVWEQVSPKLLLERTKEEITCVGIARSQVDSVIEELLKPIRAARDTRSDCFSEIVSILSRWRDADLLPELQKIINREDIDEIESILLTKGVLLLHGRSQCGKTTAARMLLAQMRARGFDIHIGQDVRDATRILGSTGCNDIAYLLDDPVGSYESNPALAWERLERFIYQLPPHRYLIVTSRTDDLYRLLGDDETDWRLGNSSWIDLTVTDRKFLMAIWRHVSAGLSEKVIEMIEQHIMWDSVDSLLQPGQLRYLSRQNDDELMNMSQSMLLSKARFNSRTLASILTSQGPAVCDLLRVLSLVATHIETTSLEDVAYILSDELTYPSEDTRELNSLKTYYFGSFNRGIYSPPQYQSVHALQNTHAEALDALERQGLIQHDNYRIRFTHPDYSESAIITREVRTQGDGVAVENFHLRAIFSIDLLTACTAAQSLRIERQRRQAKSKSCEYVFAVALRGLRSLYPAVRDICLETLIMGIDELSNAQQSLVWEELDHYYADHELIDWDNGVPWIVPAMELPLSLNTADLAPGFDTLSEQANTSYATWYALRERTLTHDELIQALEKPESFIRRETVLQLMSGNDDIPVSVLDRVLDDHPVVASAAIWALIENRTSADFLVANEVRLVQAAARVGVAIVLRRKFFRAGQRIRSYPAIEAKAEVVLKILQAVLENLPLSSRFADDIHLDDTLENFVRVLPEGKRVEIARIRFSYLIRQLQFSLPDDYGLCIGDFVLKYVPPGEPGRYEILQELLRHPETAVAVSTVASCINLWDSMAPNEQDLCMDVLVMERIDVLWLKAVALTRSRSTPEKVLECLNLPKNLFSLPTPEIIAVLGSKLIGACVRIYCGSPQPLWWIGLHHCGESTWKSVVELIATMPAHDHFEYCLDQCLYWACSGEWSGGDIVWRGLLKQVENERRERLVEMLFERTVMYNGAKLGDYWRHVFEVAQGQDYRKVISTISECIDIVQCFDSDFGDLIDLFGEEAFSDILESFPEDVLMTKVCLGVEQNRLSLEEELELILRVYHTKPPRLLFVHKWVKNLVEGISTAASSIVETVQKATQERGFAAHAVYRDSIVDEKIQDWHFCERINSSIPNQS